MILLRVRPVLRSGRRDIKRIPDAAFERPARQLCQIVQVVEDTDRRRARRLCQRPHADGVCLGDKRPRAAVVDPHAADIQRVRRQPGNRHDFTI